MPVRIEGRRQSRNHRLIPDSLALFLTIAITRSAFAGVAEDRASVAFFESRVRPVLVSRCQSCHGSDKQKGGLRLDSRRAILLGGESGPAAFPGKPEESALVQAVCYTGDLKMPPKGKLPADQVSALRRWVADGLSWPETKSSIPIPERTSNSRKEGQEPLWSFRPIVAAPVPVVLDRVWVRTPIDNFILSSLEASGLKPAPPAGKRELIRRVTFDLTGLPPTSEEVATYFADESPMAYPRLVDRLLASPHHGERYGRHWLDVVRYADSNGMDENLAFAHSWRYRDYVVRAMNSDMPFDRFAREQIAGDLITSANDPDGDRSRLAATGFLVIGPKMLAEDDPVKMEMDIVDEQVDAVGKAFLGMTLGCARCHDHKFDPISTADYYGLAGIFKSTRTMEHFRVVARWNERPLASPAEEAVQAAALESVKRKRSEIDGLLKQANERLLEAIRREKPGSPAVLPEKPEARYTPKIQQRLASLRRELATLEARVPSYPPVMAVADREAADLPIHIRGSHLTLGAKVPRRFPVALAGTKQAPFDSTRSGRVELASWLTRPEHPLTGRVLANRNWLWHFGSALVRSPDNFGRLGERPTHPGLLDWLARRVVEDGWSLKSLHRMILLSSTYQMSSAFDPRAAAVDPENRLLWRMNRRRLEAEEVRDSILAVSGRLDRTMGGSLLRTGDREYVAGTASVNQTNYQAPRRSIYLPVVRSALFDLFQAFDFADPSTGNGQRDVTTVAPQALCLMNSDMMADASRAMAAGLVGDPSIDDAGRISRAYSRALGRPPSGRECDRAREFLGKYDQLLATRSKSLTAEERRQGSFQGLCRALLASSEMLYVD